jgi:hypothetical protein
MLVARRRTCERRCRGGARTLMQGPVVRGERGRERAESRSKMGAGMAAVLTLKFNIAFVRD